MVRGRLKQQAINEAMEKVPNHLKERYVNLYEIEIF